MKKLLILTSMLISMAAICFGLYANYSLLFQKDAALAACEITDKKGKVIFKCVGEDGECSTSMLGYTLTCTGKEKDLKEKTEEEEEG